MQTWMSEWIGKPLLTRGGARIGYIRSVQTDRALRRILNLECCDEEEEEFLLPCAAVERFGKDAAVVRALAPPREGGMSAPFGRAVYSRTGERLGTADDFACEGARLTALLLSGGLRLPIGQVVGAGDALVVDLKREGRRTARLPALPCPPAGGAAERGADKADAPARVLEADTAAQLTDAPAAAQEASTGAERAGAVPNDTAAPPAAAGGAEQTLPAAQEAPRVRIRPHAGGAANAESGAAGEQDPPANDAASGTGGANGAPPGRLAGSALLTGKRLPDDLRDARGALLAPRGAVVDAALIRCALRHNKLFALTCLCTRGQ